jgi:hypothetical protein
MNSEDRAARYVAAGVFIGRIAAVFVFMGTYWHLTTRYGFLLGFGLGWLPSGLLAILTFYLVASFWPGFLLLVLIGIVLDVSNWSFAHRLINSVCPTCAAPSPKRASPILPRH